MPDQSLALHLVERADAVGQRDLGIRPVQQQQIDLRRCRSFLRLSSTERCRSPSPISCGCTLVVMKTESRGDARGREARRRPPLRWRSPGPYRRACSRAAIAALDDARALLAAKLPGAESDLRESPRPAPLRPELPPRVTPIVRPCISPAQIADRISKYLLIAYRMCAVMQLRKAFPQLGCCSPGELLGAVEGGPACAGRGADAPAAEVIATRPDENRAATPGQGRSTMMIKSFNAPGFRLRHSCLPVRPAPPRHRTAPPSATPSRTSRPGSGSLVTAPSSRRCTAAGVEVVELNGGQDANRQLEQVKDCIAQGGDGIILTADDGDSGTRDRRRRRRKPTCRSRPSTARPRT